jgi:hypothetical protein
MPACFYAFFFLSFKQPLFLLYEEILDDCGRAAIQTQGSMNNPFGSTFVYVDIRILLSRYGVIRSHSKSVFPVYIRCDIVLFYWLLGDEKWIYCNCYSLPIMRDVM